jgi:hypothetical protein
VEHAERGIPLEFLLITPKMARSAAGASSTTPAKTTLFAGRQVRAPRLSSAEIAGSNFSQ